jgi:exoribonuclease-2
MTPRARLQAIARQAMRDRGFDPDFPAAALAQLQQIPDAAADRSGRRDLRERLWASIDNDDARDLDQLSVAEPIAGGNTRILVAIADVDAVVSAGTPIDQHAAASTTSVYTAAQMFPMLPERLSTNLTSFAENEDRLALVINWTSSPRARWPGRACSPLLSATTPNWRTTAWRPGSTAAPRRRRCRLCRDSTRTSACRTPRPRRCSAAAMSAARCRCAPSRPRQCSTASSCGMSPSKRPIVPKP